MRLNSRAIGIIIVGILLIGVGLSKVMNLWQTESTKVPIKFSEGEFAGQYNPEDIRGSYTFKEITDSFEISVEDLAKAFGIPFDNNTDNFKVKDLETIYNNLDDSVEIGTSSIRYFVAIYKELPYELIEEVYLPNSAVELLKEKHKLNDEQLEYFKTHSVEIGEIESSIKYSEKQDEDERILKGKTTFKELQDWGISKERIESIIGGQIENNLITVRDYCTDNGISFSDMKETLQREIPEE